MRSRFTAGWVVAGAPGLAVDLAAEDLLLQVVEARCALNVGHAPRRTLDGPPLAEEVARCSPDELLGGSFEISE